MTEPIWSADAEESVLGAMMLSPLATESVCDVDLSSSHFYRESHGRIFTAILSLYAKGQPADAITTTAELSRQGKLDDAGGEERIHEIATLVPAQSNAKHYAEIVREKWLLRETERVGVEITSSAVSGGTAEEIISKADGLVVDLTNKLERRKDSVFTGKQLVADFRYRLAHPEEANSGIETPFPALLRPFKQERLYVLGGYAKDGKSAMALQCLRAASEAGARVGFVSIEMGRQDLTDRLVSTFGVPHHDILDGNAHKYQDVIDDALGQIESWDIEIIDDKELEPDSIRRAQRRGGYDFLVIDHLHRIQIKDKRHEREEIAENVRRITNIASEFEIPVLLLSQLARGSKHDPFPRPTQESMYGSSAIEKEAAMILFVWRIRDGEGKRTNEAELIIAANRFGSEGTRNLRFRESFVRFDEV